jgi:hypothetical protein
VYYPNVLVLSGLPLRVLLEAALGYIAVTIDARLVSILDIIVFGLPIFIVAVDCDTRGSIGNKPSGS